VKVAGIDHVGLASDFDGGGGITGWMDATQTGNVTAGLRRRGFDQAAIAKLWSGNLLRVWRDVEGVARQTPPAETVGPAKSEPFDAIFDAAMERYRVPGLAIGVVENGKVIYRRTAGETIAGSGQAITPRTLFKIASNGKAMTSAAIARLVDAGTVRWDDPVTHHLPQFRMHDPYVTREMQLRDLLIHNSGLRAGAGDLMLWPEPNLFNRQDVIRGLAHLQPIHSFRSHYDYDNLLYIVAGEAAAAAAGVSYEALLQREVFVPLGLAGCRVGAWRRSPADEIAQPHRMEDGRNVAFDADGDMIPATTMAAAGGVRCSLEDMLKWVGAWLNPMTRDASGRPWLSAAQREAMWTAQTPMPLTARMRDWDGSHFNAYGYGWRLTVVDGTQKVSHTGTLGGMYSAVTLLPERNSGFVVLINGEADEARTVINQALVKQFTAPGSDATIAHYAARMAAERAGPSAAPTLTMPAAPRAAVTARDLAPWTGVYRDPWFGDARICPRGDDVRFEAAKSPRLSGRILRRGQRLLVDWDDPAVDAEAWLDFAVAPDGGVNLRMAKVDQDADFSYDYEDLAFARIRRCD